MKLYMIIIALVFAHNLSAAQQKPNLKRAGSPIQNLDERPNMRTTTTTSSSSQSLDDEETKMVCDSQPSTRTIATQTEVQRRYEKINHALDKYLMQEAKRRNFERIKELFNSTSFNIPDVNARDIWADRFEAPFQDDESRSQTALIITAGWPEIVNFLIKQGANLNLKTASGKTALMEALETANSLSLHHKTYYSSNNVRGEQNRMKSCLETAQRLLNAGADINAGKRAKSAVEEAITFYMQEAQAGLKNMALDLIKKMLVKGAKLSGKELENVISEPTLIKLLLENGANPYLRNEEGMNFFDVVKSTTSLPAEVRALMRDYEKTQTPEHIAALQAVAQKSMQGLSRSARHEGMEEPAVLVQQYLRPDYRTEALHRENKEKEEKDNKESLSLAPMVDEK